VHAEFKKRKSGNVPPFSKMAAIAILKINEMLPFGHLSSDYEEFWYSDYVKHADSKKSKSGGVPPFAKMVTAAIVEISEILPISHLLTDFDEFWYTD
jgi:hypothetical protein